MTTKPPLSTLELGNDRLTDLNSRPLFFQLRVKVLLLVHLLPVVTVRFYARNRVIHERWEKGQGGITCTQWVKQHVSGGTLPPQECFDAVYEGTRR
jgi:hypothetical protein